LGKTLLGQRTVIVGDFASDGALVEKLKTNVNGNYDLVGLVSLNADEVGKFYHGLPVLSSLERLEDCFESPDSPFKFMKRKSGRIQQIIFSTQRIPFSRILEVMSRSREAGQRLSFKLVPSHLDVIIGKAGIDQVTEVPLLEIENRLSRLGPKLAKRIFDVVVAGLFLIIGAPLFGIAWLLGGKLQSRRLLTPNGRHLRVWQLARGGRLAKWPWLWAILSGHLTWVGMAIPPEDELLERQPEINIPLGVTDLAKIHRRGPLSPEEKNKLYLYYVTHYTPLLDLEILFRTLFKI
jgi:lipopolysaccharide/colanic/teichoic acid biosynthesis glycosyltransferase